MDVTMANVGHGQAFNPASYARAMFGSPISWRTGFSFNSSMYPHTFQSLGNFDPNSGTLSSSTESDCDPFTRTESEFCRNFTCCGLHLSDMHALVEHFEEAHVVVVDPGAHHPHHPQNMNYPAPQPQGFDPADNMELDYQSPSSSDSSPPKTPPCVPAIPTQAPYVSPPYSTLSSQPRNACPSPVSALDTIVVLPSHATASEAYVNYTPLPAVIHDQHEHEQVAVAPVMLFARDNTVQVKQEPDTFKAAAPFTSAQRIPSPTGTAPPASSAGSRPASSLLLSNPFRCPKPNCNKSYKQANGLKYHMTHGSCSFAPPKDREAIQALLAERGLSAEDDLPESDAREVEQEARRRLRPFACVVGECTRRYKNMNGLRYHYQHSGKHGAEGLRLLASGEHECPRYHNRRARQASAAAKVAANRRGTLIPVSQSTLTVQRQPQH
ncbi:unnamed protein product [Peniophora sp. CBMAI 1063]|nr:unnamed protein product [Peniophora sp. CBMAI 1063]